MSGLIARKPNWRRFRFWNPDIEMERGEWRKEGKICKFFREGNFVNQSMMAGGGGKQYTNIGIEVGAVSFFY